jgi:hypothetical protein
MGTGTLVPYEQTLYGPAGTVAVDARNGGFARGAGLLTSSSRGA